jgi:prepilin-type N-terminal cleavage/methylation domain-containing protein
VPLAGVPSAAAATPPRLAVDRSSEVVIDAGLDADGWVVLRDAFAPGWRATVDGRPATIARANSLFRAVHVPRGRHVIRFEYRPPAIAAGLTLTGMAAIILTIFGFRRPRDGRPARDAGFTLVELMVVMAIIGILLALAFARYRGMEARANEGSAYASLRTIAAAQLTFAQTCGNQKYATTLPALAQPAPATGQGFLSPDLTSGEQVVHSGYLFQMTAKPSDGAPGDSGRRFFAVNADRTIYADEEQTFTGNMPESGPPGHGVEVKGAP